jgi:multidrug resistance efflux pump
LQALAADRARLEQRVAKVAEQEAEVYQARREVELARAELADSRMEQTRVESELKVTHVLHSFVCPHATES